MYITLCDFVAGCVGGACGVLVGHPMDTIKTWQQASNCRIGRATMDIFKANNGVKGFFRGMAFPILTTGGANSILFGIYGNHLRDLQKQIKDPERRRDALAKHVFIAGSVAGFFQAFIATPIELVKIRMQARTCESRGSWDCMKRIFRNEGVGGFFRGIKATICRDVFPHGIYMLSYEICWASAGQIDYVREQREYDRWNNGSKNVSLEVAITTISGSIAGILSWIFVIPFDVVKTIMQAETDPKKYKNMFHCMKVTVKASGWKSLFRGSVMLLTRAIPVNAATFIGYEYIMDKCRMLTNLS